VKVQAALIVGELPRGLPVSDLEEVLDVEGSGEPDIDMLSRKTPGPPRNLELQAAAALGEGNGGCNGCA
jgi:hypothetical protein